MSRKGSRVQVELNPKGVKKLSRDEIAVILRGADELIASGGRTLLGKVLKGSKDKKLVERGLDQNPVYGIYDHLGEEDILARIDRVILDGYLEIEYDGRLPLLVYTAKGWEVEKETYANELLDEFDQMLSEGRRPYDMNFLVDRNRDLIFLLLDKVERSHDQKFVPLLEDWEAVDHKKVRIRIQEVIDALRQAS